MNKRLQFILYFAFFLLISAFGESTFGQKESSLASPKPRTIVTTDGELDDVDSFIRMLLYTNEYKVEGLIVSSSQWHYKGDGKGTKFTSEMEMTKKLYGERTELRWPGEQWIYDLVDAYGKVYPNLVKHSKDFPTHQYLRDRIRIGNIDFEGEMEKDTEGSDFIKAKLLDDDTSPLYLQVWGGTNTIARALKSIEIQYKNTPEWDKIYKKVCQKAIIYAILDQDATYKKYIEPNWKDIKVYYNANQFWSFAYFWKRAVPEQLHPYLEGKFMGDIINNHGPLLKMYYSYGDGNPPLGEIEDIYSSMEKAKKNQWGSFGQYDFISEGDSPAFLHLVDVGLNNLENPQDGGWGGRLVQSTVTPSRWEDGKAAADYNPFTQKMDDAYAQTKWIPAIQEDFAARADWCIKDFKNANHAPKISVKEGNKLKVKAGEKITLNAITTDPDGNKVAIKVWQYQEVDTAQEAIKIETKGSKSVIEIPNNLKSGENIHIIVEGKDNGTPSLTRYQRVVLTVR
ncbi:DUF1593 domain-containing protein [Lacihabitans soyangensis]|uniref:DUF1593 domain-containing protein n=1 Tax=Lacihabitans soyangensis TaxID=869394 RepID=A0AAE3H013_9BACT|nr:DUF1593 domain-containing protein [Lacihabitans soyangensis]MCP9762318.1 DUF1593 domain-containing protein [Lacihabitans soyangensis]